MPMRRIRSNECNLLATMHPVSSNRTRKRIHLLTAAAGLITGLAIYLPANLSAAPEYADARACAACHRKIADDYARTGMGR